MNTFPVWSVVQRSSDPYESGEYALSHHASRIAALQAMLNAKRAAYRRWDSNRMYGKSRGEKFEPWHFYQIREITVHR